jgi:autotransporter-associated beta strand protein
VRLLALAIVGTLLSLAISASSAQGAIVIQDALATTTYAYSNAANASNLLTSGTAAYTVTSGANALVVQFDQFVQTNGAQPVNMYWITSAGTQNVSLGFQQAGATSTYPYADVFYLFNPNPGVGTLSFTTSARTAALSAFSLNGVNTGVLPVTGGSSGATTATSLGVALPITVAGSFEVVAESNRNAKSNAYTLATTNGTANQQWSSWDTNAAEFGGGYVAGLSAGTQTVTWTNTSGTFSRNAIAAEVFAPLAYWIGASSSNWGTGANWNTGTVPSSTASLVFGSAGASGSVDLGSSGRTVSGLLFQGVSTTISSTGGFALTLSYTAAAPVNVYGNNAINTNVSLNSPAAFYGQAGSQMTISGNVSDGTASNGVNVSGSGILYLTASNSYTGATVVNGGYLVFGSPGSLYGGNSASWTPANITVNSGAGLAVGFGGSNDFTQAQASSLMSALSTGTTSGLTAGASFGLDTSRATGPVTYSGTIVDSTAGALGFAKFGNGILNLTAANNYSGPTSITNGELIRYDTNSGTGTNNATNVNSGGLTVLSIRNAVALGSGTADSQLAPITLNATGGSLSTSILEIGTSIGSDPGGNNADFSYQVVAPGSGGGTATPTNVVAGPGQINLGYLGNSNDGTGFAAYNANSLSSPRTVALYSPSTTTLATLQLKQQFGQGGGDHLTLGSPTSNNTVILLNPIDLNGGSQRRWASIRGVGITPEGEYSGQIINSAGNNDNISFDGNGGLIFNNANSTYGVATIQINGGAVYVAASDPAAVGSPGAMGSGTATIQVGTSTTINPSGGTPVPTSPTANLAFMTYGMNAGVGPAPTESTNRNIAVGGAGVVYNSVTLGGVTDDYTAMNGNIALNETPTTPTTFTARNGGRVDFGGTISGTGSVLVGNSVVEGDATAPGIALNNNGTIVFFGANTYTGTTTVSAGKLYINGSLAASSSVTVLSGATLGGKGTILSPVNVTSGGILEAGQVGSGTLTLNGGLNFSGSGTITYGSVQPSGSPPLVVGGTNTLNTNNNTVLINITGSIPGAGNYALIGYNGIQANQFTLSSNLPNRATGSLTVVGNELDLAVSSLASIVWTGSQNSSWNTTSTNWVVQGGGATQYINSPGDSVIFDDSAGANTSVVINSGNVNPTSVTFANNSATYTISGSNSIAGATGLRLTGTGTVVLLNTNTFTGATSIGPGATLQLGNGVSGHDGSISQTSGISNSGSLTYNVAGSQVFGGVISGPGSVTVNGPGLVSLTNTSTFAGNTTINGGTLQLGLGTFGNDGALTGNIADNGGALVLNYFGNVSLAGAVSGSGAIFKSGAGTATLNSLSNNFNGALTVNSGVLSLPNGLSGGNVNVTSLSGGSTAKLILAPGVNLFVGTSNSPTSFMGTISGGGNLTYNGTSSLTLAGANTYLGVTRINSGTLQGVWSSGGTVSNFGTGNIVNNGALVLTRSGGADPVFNQTITGTGTTTFQSLTGNYINFVGSPSLSASSDFTLLNTGLNTGLISQTIGALSGNGTLVSNFGAGNVTWTIGANGDSGTFSGNISGGFAGVINIVKNGSGVQTLSGTNTFAGSTLVSGGTLLLADPLALEDSNVDTSGAGALSFGTLTAATLGGLINGGPLSLNNAGGAGVALSVGNNGTSTTYSGALSGNGSLTKIGGGALTLTGVNTYVGSTAVVGGVIDETTTASLPNWPTATVAIGGSGGMAFRVQTPNAPAGSWSDANILSLLGNGNVSIAPGGSIGFDVVGGDTYTPSFNLALTVAGAGSANGIAKLGEGKMLLANANTYTGPTTIWAGTLQLGNGSAGSDGSLASTSIVNNGTLVYDLVGGGTVSAVISGGGSLSSIGPSMLTLTATNSYTGTTTVVGGTLSISNGLNLGAAPAAFNPASITLDNATLQIANTTGFNNSTLNPNRGITLISAATINVPLISGGTFNVNGSEMSTQYGGVITGSGNLTITGGAGTNSGAAPYLLELGGTNSYTGNTTINNATVSLMNGFNGGTGPANILPTTSVLNLVNNGWFVLNNGTANQTLAGLTGDSTGVLTTTNQGAAANYTINPAAGQSYTFAGFIGAETVLSRTGNAGRITLTIAGQGTQILTGTNAYSGATTITSGTLQLGNGGDSGSVSASVVTDNATLAVSRSDEVALNSLISGALGGGGGLLQTGPGQLDLTAANTYAGPTQVTGGTLKVAAVGALGTGALVANGGVVDLAGIGATVPSFSGSAGIVTNSSLGFLATMDVNNASTTTFSGSLVDGAGPVGLQLDGATLTLAHSNAYSGPTTLNSGELIAAAAGALSTSSAITLSGGSLAVTAGSQNVAATVTLSVPSSTIAITGGGTLNIAANVQDNAGGIAALHLVSADGAGTLILSSSNNYGGGTFVDSGTMIVTNPSAIADGTNLTVGNAALFAPSPIVPSQAGSGGAGAASVASVPEPGTLLLVAAGGALLAVYRKRRKR